MAAFFYELDRNVESVDDFFSKKSSDMQRRLKLLIDKYGDSRSDQLDYHELEDLVHFPLNLTENRSAR
jgi:glycerophosphodiester phosphodiesterase